MNAWYVTIWWAFWFTYLWLVIPAPVPKPTWAFYCFLLVISGILGPAWFVGKMSKS